ncbi:hypothetical protein [Modestobacter marinus]|uniref:hypothetical protein n=1 Tax=Modestobacter marinus TaxID=477641 RepID=UPI001C940058|nr:hypothetical protein [Modestobacter marinus]
MLVRLGAGVAAAVVAGTALGVASRALMALVSLTSGGSSSFTVSGTFFILLVYVLAMIPGGAVAGLTTHRARWLLPVAGALFLCVPAVGVAGAEIGATTGFGLAQWLGVGAGTAAVFVTIALVPVVTVRLADRWLGRRGAVVPEAATSSPATAAR